MARKRPLLTTKQAQEVHERALEGKYGFRCFFGMHVLAVYHWPIGGRWHISDHTVCTRCGWLNDITLVSEGK